MTRHILPPETYFFAYRIVMFEFFKLNIKARHEIREIMPDIISKLLRAAQCTVQFKSEQTPFPRTGRRYRPAALHRI